MHKFCSDFCPNNVLLGVLNSFLRCVRPLCRCWCPPFCVGHITFLFIYLPGLSLLVSGLFRWPCSVSQVCHCWCPPFSVGDEIFLFISLLNLSLVVSTSGHVTFLFISLPGLSLLVTAFFRWSCSISGHLSPRCVIVGVRPFALAMQHFFSFP